MIIKQISEIIKELEEFYFNTVEGQIIFTIITIVCFIFIIINTIQSYKRIFKKDK